MNNLVILAEGIAVISLIALVFEYHFRLLQLEKRYRQLLKDKNEY